MKKKLVLVVAMILVAITACACLAGCVPNRPDKFLAAFIKSDHKGIVTGEAETGIDGNKIIVKVNDKNQTIYEETKDKLNIYICIAGNWTAESIAIDKVDNDYKELKESMTSEETPEQLKAISENFEENFEKDKEGWWKLKSILRMMRLLRKKQHSCPGSSPKRRRGKEVVMWWRIRMSIPLLPTD